MYFFFCRPHFHGPCTSGLQSSWEESQVLSCSLIHICQGLGLTDKGSSSLISPWYGLGILEWAEVCFLQTHTELKSSKFSNWKRGSLKRSLSWMGQCGLMSLQCLWSHHMRKAGNQKVEQQEPMKIPYDRAGVCTIQEKTLPKGMAQSALWHWVLSPEFWKTQVSCVELSLCPLVLTALER